MKKLLDAKRIFLVGGAGGVGKTTVAAALGVELARRGYRTVVLTVDPARRLAQALGFRDFKKELQEVEVGETNGGSGQLFATMLDPQIYFDRVIGKFATNDEQRRKILANPLYRTMVDSLGGSHEYAAMERLLEFARDARFDKIVVDTPPTQNAVDLFNAPQRMADFMDHSVLRWFQGGGKMYLQFFRAGTKLAMKLLQMIFGSEFLDQIGVLFGDLEGMQSGFKNRNLEVLEIMRDPKTAFMLVSYPSEARYLESRSFTSVLDGKSIALSALLLNRIESAVPDPKVTPWPETAAARDTLAYLALLRRQQQVWIDRFESLAGENLVCIPRQSAAPHDVSGLTHFASLLVS